MLHLSVLCHFDISAIYPQGFHSQICYDTPCFILQQYLLNIVIQSAVSCADLWANIRCSGCSPLGEKWLWNRTIQFLLVLRQLHKCPGEVTPSDTGEHDIYTEPQLTTTKCEQHVHLRAITLICPWGFPLYLASSPINFLQYNIFEHVEQFMSQIRWQVQIDDTDLSSVFLTQVIPEIRHHEHSISQFTKTHFGSSPNVVKYFSASQGPWFNIKMISYQYRKSHCGDKTILRPSYLHNEISYTGKMTSLYWIRAQVVWIFFLEINTHKTPYHQKNR